MFAATLPAYDHLWQWPNWASAMARLGFVTYPDIMTDDLRNPALYEKSLRLASLLQRPSPPWFVPSGMITDVVFSLAPGIPRLNSSNPRSNFNFLNAEQEVFIVVDGRV